MWLVGVILLPPPVALDDQLALTTNSIFVSTPNLLTCVIACCLNEPGAYANMV